MTLEFSVTCLRDGVLHAQVTFLRLVDIKSKNIHFILSHYVFRAMDSNGLVNDVSTLLYWVSHLSVGFNKTHLAKFMRKSLTLMENVLIFTT